MAEPIDELHFDV